MLYISYVNTALGYERARTNLVIVANGVLPVLYPQSPRPVLPPLYFRLFFGVSNGGPWSPGGPRADPTAAGHARPCCLGRGASACWSLQPAGGSQCSHWCPRGRACAWSVPEPPVAADASARWKQHHGRAHYDGADQQRDRRHATCRDDLLVCAPRPSRVRGGASGYARLYPAR